jgi:hypothetical protein
VLLFAENLGNAGQPLATLSQNGDKVTITPKLTFKSQN